MKTFKKVLNIAVDVLIILVLIVSAFVLISVFSTTKGGDGVPNLFGKAPISVLTDSMKGDKPDNFNKGDLLICDIVDENTDHDYKVGDIVTFRFDINGDDISDLVTHRIYKINKNGSYQTKGDNNVTYDQDPDNTVFFGNIQNEDILATYHGTKIAGAGSFLDYLRSPIGFFICILLPMIIFFIYQAVRVIANAMAYSREKGRLQAEEAIANSDLTEEQKQQAIAEYLASQKAEVEKNAAAEEKPEESAEPKEE